MSRRFLGAPPHNAKLLMRREESRMHNIACNIIDHGHFALSLESEHKPVSLYGDGRCSSYLTGIRKTSDATDTRSGVIHCDVTNCEVNHD